MEGVPEMIVNLPPEILEAGTKMGIEDAGKWRGDWTYSSDARKIITGDLQLWDSGCFPPPGIPPGEDTVPDQSHTTPNLQLIPVTLQGPLSEKDLPRPS